MTGYSSKGISEAVLKNIAVLTMTIDHVTAVLLRDYLRSTGVMNLYDDPWYFIGRVIGRIAFVLYAFMIAEGAYHTKNRIKYAARLIVLAGISIIPHSYVNTERLFNPNDLNIFFLLFLGLLTIYAYEWLRNSIENKALSVSLRLLAIAAAGFLALHFKIEYGMMGILLILAFYIFRYDTPKMLLSVTLVMTVGYMANVILSRGAVNWFASHQNDLLMSILRTDRIQVFGLLAIPFILLYNGKKGRQLPKWFYYLYYPVHLGILALIVYLT